MLKKILYQISTRIDFEYISNSRYKIPLYTKKMSARAQKKLIRYLARNNINRIVLAKGTEYLSNKLKENDFYVFNGKMVFKYMLNEVIEYIFKIKHQCYRDEEVYVTVVDDRDTDVIIDIAKKFKNLNIVTDNIKKLKRLDKKLENNTDIVYSISNNKKKGLRRAKFIINFNCGNNFFESYKINKDAIILNLSANGLSFRNAFSGIIVEKILITYFNSTPETLKYTQFDSSELYESVLFNLKYVQARNQIELDDCKVCCLVGIRGVISEREFIANNS